MKKKRVAVRTLVESILLSGSLSPMASAQRMLEGAEGHRALQSIALEGAENEVSVRGVVRSAHIELTVYGRIDRLYDASCVEEIKTTYLEKEQLHGGSVQHWAQAKCYAHLYCAEHGLSEIEVRLTYFQLSTGELFSFDEHCTADALSAYFADLAELYLARLEGDYLHALALSESTREMPFPYPAFRSGQRTFAAQVYYAILKKTPLLAQAPTGTGKTMAVLFPSLKALGEGLTERIFYLTARTTQQEAAVSALRLAGVPGLRTVVLSAKEKACIYDHPVCREGSCPRAEGYYDRLNAALDEAVRFDGVYTREQVAALAAKHFLCPFELSLDLSSVCDVIIGDYNYAFDPRVRLQRFFAKGKDPSILLIDEAHNLPDRARDMYSTTLPLSDVVQCRRSVPKQRRKTPLYRALRTLAKAFEECFSDREIPCAAPNAPTALLPAMEAALAALSAEDIPADTEISGQLRFSLSTFRYILDQYDEDYLTLYEGSKSTRRITLFCTDAAKRLADTYKKCIGSVLFSATLTPHTFYRNLCGLAENAALLSLPSPFPSENLAVFHLSVDTRYKARAQTMDAVIDGIAAFVQGRCAGNYLVFLPSHAYLAAVSEGLQARLPEADFFVQRPDMDDNARENYLARFQPAPVQPVVGLAVMGGVFAEGIDLPGDRLSGAAIVGVGLPQLCLSRNVLKDAYEMKYGEGYRYAYQYPGIGKVLQAAGRVIRTETDRGVLLLVDDRYGYAEYRALLPESWQIHRVRDIQSLRLQVSAFWNKAETE